MDPLAPNVLWASFWGDGIYRSTDGGTTWSNAMTAACRTATSSPAAPGSRSASRTRPAQHADALHRLRLLRQEGHLPPGSRGLQDHRRRSRLEAPAHRRSGDRPGQHPRLLHHAVLLRQRGHARPDQPRHRLRRGLLRLRPVAAVGRHLPQSPTAARPGRTSATTCTPTSTPSPSSPTTPTHVVIGNDGGVWQSHNQGGRLAAGAAAVRRRLGEPQRHGRPGHRRAGALAPACGSPSSPASPPCRTVPGRYWGGTQDNGTQRKSTGQRPLVRPGQR